MTTANAAQSGCMTVVDITRFGRPTMRKRTSDQPAGDDWKLPSAKASVTAAPVVQKQAPAHGGKWRRFVAATDIHGDKQDADSVNALWRFMEHWKPELKFCLGDVWDFRPLRNGAGPEERSESMQEDYESGLRFIERFFDGDGEKYLNLGNHDYRLWDWAETRRGVERDFAAGRVMIVEERLQQLGVKWVPYHKRHGVIKVGHLRLLHGFHCGVFAARQAAAIYGSCLMGHTHCVDEHHTPGLERRACRIIGALCKLDMEYNARQPNTLKQANGFAYGVINKLTGDYHVWQAESFGGEWIVPSDVVEL